MDKSNKLDFSSQDIFVGLDTHLKNWRVSIIVGESPFKTFSQDPRPKLLKYRTLKCIVNIFERKTLDYNIEVISG